MLTENNCMKDFIDKAKTYEEKSEYNKAIYYYSEAMRSKIAHLKLLKQEEIYISS